MNDEMNFEAQTAEQEAFKGTFTVAVNPRMVYLLGAVAGERIKQDLKWGEQNHDPLEWYAILGEEFGEVGKELCENAAYARKLMHQLTGDEVEDDRIVDAIDNSPHLPRLRTELIHLLAVGVAMLESLERNQGVSL